MASEAARFKAPLEDSALHHSLETPSLPPYSEYPQDTDIGLPNLTPSTTTNSTSHGEAFLNKGGNNLSGTAANHQPSETASFNPTIQLQIQADGKRWLSLPFPPKPDSISVFDVTPDDGRRQLHSCHRPLYQSLRATRSSGSSYLVHGDAEGETPPSPLTTTTYRFGLGRAPTVELLLPSHLSADEERKRSIEIRSRSPLSRAVVFTAPSFTGGCTFVWRYAGSKERGAVGADSLLVLERLEEDGEQVALNALNNKKGKKGNDDDDDDDGSSSQTKREKRNPIVAKFLRNAEFRTPGTSARTAGNGGRLMLDLSTFRGGDDGEGMRGERERVQLLVVTTVLVMLKKEVDRRRTAQVAIMCAGAGGGGG